MSAAESWRAACPSTLPRRPPKRSCTSSCAGEVAGAERLLVDLASRPQASDAAHVVALFTPSERVAAALQGRRPHRSSIAAACARTPRVPVALARPDRHRLAGAAHARERATIVHLHTFASHVLGTRAARQMGLRIVRTEHAADVYRDMSCWPFSRWSLQRADAVVAVERSRAGRRCARAP